MAQDIDTIIARHFEGSTASACAAFGVSRQAIGKWRANGIPPIRLYQVKAVIAAMPKRRKARK